MRSWMWVVGLLVGCEPVASDIEAYCALELSCRSSEWESAASCETLQQDAVDVATAECAEANEALLSCRAGLATCDELADYWDEPEGGYPCSEEDAQVGETCFSAE